MVELVVGSTTTTTQSDANLCRLCLKQDDFVIDIYEQQQQLDADLKKPSLSQRLSDLFQIRYEKSSALPNSICQRCLYMVEAFTSFRENVQKCETELQKRLLKPGEKSTGDAVDSEEQQRSGLNGHPGIFEPEDDCIITVVDPNQEYESSDDDFSMESDSEPEDLDEEDDVEKAGSTDISNAQSTEQQQIAAAASNDAQLQPMLNVEATLLPPPPPPPIATENLGLSDVAAIYSAPTLETLAMEFTKNTFLCQYCDMAFTTQLECADHESRHDAANPFSCNFCSFRTTNRQNVIHHIKELHDNERPYVCALCNKGFCRRSDLKKHTIVHTGVRPFTCPVCSKSFSRNTNLTKHMRIHSGVKPHVCQKCPRSFSTAGELLRHARSHAEVKPFQCGKCPASFTRRDKLVLHEQAHFRKESEFLLNQSKAADGKQRTLPASAAPMENIVVSLNPFADINTSLDANNYAYQNLIAEDPYKHSILAAQLQQNRPASRGAKPYDKPPSTAHKSNSRIITCGICDKTFTRERDLQRHQALHLDKLFTCKECGRGFQRREKLARHELQEHVKRPQFTCDQCGITFSKREALHMHMKVHELQHNMAMTQVALNAAQAANGSPVLAVAAGELLQQRLAGVRPPSVTSAADMSFYSQLVPTMNLGFYSETRPEDRNGI